MKGKNIVFLCYSRYVIYVAFCLKELLHKNDRCTLIISNIIKNENGIIEHIKKTGIWDRVIEFEEYGTNPEQIRNSVKKFVDNEEIDIFYTANVLRCASHYFIHFLKDTTEINLFDEGIISLDLVGGYDFFKRKGLPIGWIEFDFNRINKFYVFFPDITKPFGNVEIVPIDMAQILHLDITQFVNQLNEMFDYFYISCNKRIMFIDSDMASQGSITQEYENHCIDNVMNLVDSEKCIVKLKPSIPQKMIDLKYGKYDVEFLDGGTVPFEVIYLNAIINNDVPNLIIALPTTAIWNINLINQEMKIRNVDIISLSKIMYEYFYYPGNGDDMMNRLQGYQECFDRAYAVKLPETWEDFYEYFIDKYSDLCNISVKASSAAEYEWLVKEYNRLTLLYEKNKLDIRNIILKKWVALNNRGIKIEQFFLDKGIKEIILYGYGVFGALFSDAIDKKELRIQYVVKSVVTEKDKYFNSIPVISVEEYADKSEKFDVPILVTAVGKEQEIFEIINAKHIGNVVYSFMDIMNYFDAV